MGIENQDELQFHKNFRNLIDLKHWINGLDDNTIFTNHQIAIKFTGANQFNVLASARGVSPHGVSPHGVMNLLLKNKVLNYLMQKIHKQWVYYLIIIFLNSVCNFPGHVFAIYCSRYYCMCLQSIINWYLYNQRFF